jgi:hypothetical protein
MGYTTLRCNSIPSALDKTMKFIPKWDKDDPKLCWFRGVKDTNLSLRPGAYWRTDYTELEPLLSMVQEGVAYSDVGSLDQWDTYYLAQHHGIPTRLLDWTESFVAALFFAFDGWDGITTPCIWVLQPALLNEVFLDWKGIIAPSSTACTSAWLPKKIAQKEPIVALDEEHCKYDNNWPLAIYPQKTNNRIVAQQGSFTVHGRKTEALDVLIAEAGGDPAKVVAKIELIDFNKEHVMSNLSLLGIRRSAIYPDFDNFVLQLKDYYKW